MKKKNCLFVAAGFSSLLIAGCGPSIEDAQRHAEKAAEESVGNIPVSTDDADISQSLSKTTTNLVASDHHDLELVSNTTTAVLDVKEVGDAQPETDQVVLQEEGGDKDIAPEQVVIDVDPVMNAEDRMLDKISELRDRLQHARASKDEASRSIEQIHRLLSDNEAEMETLLSTLNNLEQSVQQLDREISDVATEVQSDELLVAPEGMLVEAEIPESSDADMISNGDTTNTVSE